jgi:cell division protein FtsL
MRRIMMLVVVALVMAAMMVAMAMPALARHGFIHECFTQTDSGGRRSAG